MRKFLHAFTRFELSVVRNGFTLIELLVVITIIVVLLALLTPALDKAIYQAELAVCATKQKAIATGVTMYASAHKRRYPYRAVVHEGGSGEKPNQMSRGRFEGYEAETGQFAGSPDLQRIAEYMDINGTMNDPLNEDVDWEASRPETIREMDYQLWFGWNFRFEGTHRAMNKIGDRFSWTGLDYNSATDPNATRTFWFRWLASDLDFLAMDENALNSHPDADGLLHEATWQDEGGARSARYPARLSVGPCPAGRPPATPITAGGKSITTTRRMTARSTALRR